MKSKELTATYQKYAQFSEAVDDILVQMNKELEELKRLTERHHEELFEECDHCRGTGDDPNAYMTTASCQACKGGEVRRMPWLEICNQRG